MNFDSYRFENNKAGDSRPGITSSEILPTVIGKRASLQDEELDCRYHLENAPDAVVTIKGKDCLFFSGSAYLGHQVHPDLMAAVCESILLYGLSSARLKRHYLPTPILEVGRTAARFFGTERAFYSSGRQEAFRLLTESIIKSYDAVFIDEYCHNFIFDTFDDLKIEMKLDPILYPFKHRSVSDLQERLEQTLRPGDRPLVITEGIFPLFGTIAPIREYIDLLKQYDHGALLLEDSHALGILGKTGKGVLEYFNYDTNQVNRTPQDLLEPDLTDQLQESDRTMPIDVFWSASLSKAIGGMGGIIPGTRLFIDRIMEKGLSNGDEALYTPGAAASIKGLELAYQEGKLREKLWENALFLKQSLKKYGITVEENGVPVVSFRYGASAAMRTIQRRLADCGILITYIPRGQGVGSQGVLRMTLSVNHERAMIEQFLEVLGQILQGLN